MKSILLGSALHVQSPVPGAQALIAGDATEGWYGEVPTTNFIGGAELATLVGLGNGTAFNSSEPWLKFALDGKTLFIPKKPYRNTLSWAQLSTAGLISGSKVVTIRGRKYKVRLIKGANANPAQANHDTSNPTGANASEWLRTIENVGATYTAGKKWASYTDADLGVSNNTTGSSTLCQEESAWNQSNANDAARSYCVLRGYKGLLNYYVTLKTNTGSNQGWRPVLELAD